jgi:hypothetical protein
MIKAVDIENILRDEALSDPKLDTCAVWDSSSDFISEDDLPGPALSSAFHASPSDRPKKSMILDPQLDDFFVMRSVQTRYQAHQAADQHG